MVVVPVIPAYGVWCCSVAAFSFLTASSDSVGGEDEVVVPPSASKIMRRAEFGTTGALLTPFTPAANRGLWLDLSVAAVTVFFCCRMLLMLLGV